MRDEPPSQLLERLYHQATGRSYKKVTNGVQLFERLDPKLVYQVCPHFREMMDTMLALAKGAGL